MGIEQQVENVGDIMIDQGPWAALAWFLFLLVISGVVWYVKSQKKAHRENVKNIINTKDAQIDAAITSSERMLGMAKELSEGSKPAIEKLAEEIKEIKRTVYNIQNLVNAAKNCPLTDVNQRRNVIEDIGDDVTSKIKK